MLDEDVAALLDSDEPLVVIEAPAGCGKTFQGAQYANRAATKLNTGRVLILTHTHAACGVFAKETRGASGKVEIRTIDSLIVQIATAYHKSLALPADPTVWARQNNANGFPELASRVNRLLSHHPMICTALADRYPIIIGDEHQDSNSDQDSIMMAIHKTGSNLRVFGDPMQRIYRDDTQTASATDNTRWEEMKSTGRYVELENPHRWRDGHEDLGRWILQARETLKNKRQIDLTNSLPCGLTVLYAENIAQQSAGYQTSKDDRTPIDQIVKASGPILVLTGQNKTVDSLRAFWNRTIPIWEGHTRQSLGDLVCSFQLTTGDASAISEAVVAFLQEVAVGFSPSSHGNRFKQEIVEGCKKPTHGKPEHIQQLGRFIIEEPNHIGISKCLQHLHKLSNDRTPGFETIRFDYRREFKDAIRIGEFADPDEGFAEVNRRRSFARPMPPKRAISTIHKAKGLECDNTIILPCDRQVFSSTNYSRCKLYVALSRAKQSLTLVVSRNNPSPLFYLG
jgi:UvrD/REP helicase N-terminal domain/UvrD-like helicase C-terminal domain